MAGRSSGGCTATRSACAGGGRRVRSVTLVVIRFVWACWAAGESRPKQYGAYAPRRYTLHRTLIVVQGMALLQPPWRLVQRRQIVQQLRQPSGDVPSSSAHVSGSTTGRQPRR